MSEYDEMSLQDALKLAFSYLKNIYDTNEIILSIRVFGWAKTGIFVGSVLYALVR